MGVSPLSSFVSSVNDLQELGTIRYGHTQFRIYWKKETREVVLVHNGVPYLQANGLIRESLSAFLPMPVSVVCCAVYEANGLPSLPLNEPDDLLRCEWSDYACDRLLLQATLSPS